MRAILINPENRSIKEIQIEGGLDSMYKAMDCEVVEAPISFDNEDVLYCDEEGLFKPQKGGITMKDWCMPILGKMLIVGTDEEGCDVDAVSRIRDVRKSIIWVSECDAEWYRSHHN